MEVQQVYVLSAGGSQSNVLWHAVQKLHLFLFYRTLRPHSAETTTLNSFP